MSAEVVASSASDVDAARIRRPLVLALGLKEAQRILRSPANVVALGFVLVVSGLGSVLGERSVSVPDPGQAYDVVLYLALMWAGLLTYVAAHLVTTSARRTHADRVLEALPGSERHRGGALCAGVVLGPGLVAVGLTVLLAWLGTRFVVTTEGEHPFSLAELVHLPLVVVGGGLFAVVVATWLRFPGSLPLGLVALVFVTVWLGDDARASGTGWFAPWSTASDLVDETWTYRGSQAWHAVYLAGLCALGACAVALRQREGRRRWLGVSAAVLCLTMLAGWAQL